MEASLLNKGKTMETSTGELIAKLTNISMNLALELKFKEASVIMEAVGALTALPDIAESMRPSKGISYLSQWKRVEDWDIHDD